MSQNDPWPLHQLRDAGVIWRTTCISSPNRGGSCRGPGRWPGGTDPSCLVCLPLQLVSEQQESRPLLSPSIDDFLCETKCDGVSRPVISNTAGTVLGFAPQLHKKSLSDTNRSHVQSDLYRTNHSRLMEPRFVQSSKLNISTTVTKMCSGRDPVKGSEAHGKWSVSWIKSEQLFDSVIIIWELVHENRRSDFHSGKVPFSIYLNRIVSVKRWSAEPDCGADLCHHQTGHWLPIQPGKTREMLSEPLGRLVPQMSTVAPSVSDRGHVYLKQCSKRCIPFRDNQQKGKLYLDKHRVLYELGSSLTFERIRWL